jgi:hypothetical protein
LRLLLFPKRKSHTRFYLFPTPFSKTIPLFSQKNASC